MQLILRYLFEWFVPYFWRFLTFELFSMNSAQLRLLSDLREMKMDVSGESVFAIPPYMHFMHFFIPCAGSFCCTCPRWQHFRLECHNFWPFGNLLGRCDIHPCLIDLWCIDLMIYPGGIYSMRLTFCDRYPEKPPKVRFTTKMFHPNVYADGNICLDIIAAKWSPSYTVSSILTSIQSLLTDPNVQSPANPVRSIYRYFFRFPFLNCFFQEAAELFVKDKKAYERRVRRIAEESLASSWPLKTTLILALLFQLTWLLLLPLLMTRTF